ncbi:MAG: hypothetical protein Kow00128_18360 [Deltaproteobacteria bacterium]
MSYEALARKWRPRTFGEIVGQGHVTRALANAISLGRIHHAYLFTGTRGVGKTTFARILARALNCEQGPTSAPCLSCPACTELLAGSAVDVQEIDGASNTGIDDVRRLRENAVYAPAKMRYKIYIIDEVHMLSKAAFNGLLKILEEPPPHVVFVFATTEPNRIPETILSRVQRFDFRMLSEEEIAGRLREMAKAEKLSCEEEALSLMARHAFGSMRDGQSILEQAAVLGDGTVTAALVEEMLGLAGTEAAIDLVDTVVRGGAADALRRFRDLFARGADLKYLYLSVVDLFRDAAVLSFSGAEELLYRHSPSSLARMRELVPLRSREEWMFLLDIAFRSEKDVLGTEFPRLGFELLLLRLVNAPGLLSLDAFESGTAASPAEAETPAGPTFEKRQARRERPPAAAPGREAAGGGENLWESIRKVLDQRKKPLVVALLAQMEGTLEGEELVISCPHRMQLDRLREEDKWSVLLEAVEAAAGRKIPVRLAVSGEKKSPDAEPLAEKPPPQRAAFADPMMAEVLREFEGATVLEVRPAPRRRPVSEEREEEEPERFGDPEDEEEE